MDLLRQNRLLRHSTPRSHLYLRYYRCPTTTPSLPHTALLPLCQTFLLPLFALLLAHLRYIPTPLPVRYSTPPFALLPDAALTLHYAPSPTLLPYCATSRPFALPHALTITHIIANSDKSPIYDFALVNTTALFWSDI